ncbi:MAG TPA: zinc-binding dehydrogenase [Xanthomonadales bacterium]|nr:zinc-binding dehydrogenase [Xanthomonadales bacterium]
MRAQVIRSHGGVDVFEPAELPLPVAGPGQVLVRVVASSVNPVDTKIRRKGGGAAPALPAVLGADVAGVVAAVGPGVQRFAVGDAVYGCVGGVRGLQGTLAEYVAADERLLARAPHVLPLADAAALPLVAITAWEGLVEEARVQRGESVLVLGGTGGVGHVAVQLARELGAVVTAAVSSADKARLAKELGAVHVVDYRKEPVADYVARITNGRGFDVVFDATGGSDPSAAFAAAKLRGRVVTIVTAFTADLSPMHMKGLSLHAVFMPIPMLHDVGREAHGAILREVARLVDAGKLEPIVDSRFPLERAADAHARLESGAAVGKVVVDVAAP